VKGVILYELRISDYRKAAAFARTHLYKVNFSGNCEHVALG